MLAAKIIPRTSQPHLAYETLKQLKFFFLASKRYGAQAVNMNTGFKLTKLCLEKFRKPIMFKVYMNLNVCRTKFQVIFIARVVIRTPPGTGRMEYLLWRFIAVSLIHHVH